MISILYIPHGSDERLISAFISFVLKRFISHMVQMKGVKGINATIMLSTLYPTWFR